MTWEALVTLTLVAGLLIALSRGVAPTDVLLLGSLGLLAPMRAVSNRFPSPAELIAAFGNEGVATIAALFVITAGLSHTGAAQHVGGALLGHPRTTRGAQVRLMLPVVGLSAFVNNTPVVATLLPVVREWSSAGRYAEGQLLIPLSYAAVLGGMCTLIGTSTNLVVQGLLVSHGLPPLGMFTLSPVGIPIALAGVLLLVAAGSRLLPTRSQAPLKLADSRHYAVAMRVLPDSGLIGRSIESGGLRRLESLFLSEVQRAGVRLPAVDPSFVLQADDTLFFVGVVRSVAQLQRLAGLEPAVDDVHALDIPRSDRRLVEAVVSPTSPLLNQTLRESGFRGRYDAVVIAIHRNGHKLEGKLGEVLIHRGDTLLVEAGNDFIERHRDDSDFLVLAPLVGRVTLHHERAGRAITILLSVVGLATLEPITGVGVLPIALLGALATVATGCCTVREARDSVEWPVLLSIGAALGLAKALTSTGAADLLTTGLLGHLTQLGPLAALAGVYLITLVLTELVTNNAAAALAFPVALAAAAQVEASPMPFVVAVALAASSGFATPIGYQTHMMVHSAGGYRFTDFVRIGLPMDLLCFALAITLIPWVFPF